MITTKNTSTDALEKDNLILILRNEVSYLKEQLEWFRRQVFGQRSEKIIPQNEDQLLLDGFEALEAPKDATRHVGAHERRIKRRSGGDKVEIPKDLPVERTVLDIPEDQKVCPETGKPLVKIGEEISRKLAHRPGSFFIKEIARPKYALPKGSEEGIVCAELPDSLLPRCQADESLLAEIAVNKFADHLPLHRLEEILARHRIKISRQLLSQWVIGASFALEPLYDEMLKAILDSGNIFVDESPVSLLCPRKGKVQEAYMWVIVGGGNGDPPLRIYDFRENRKHSNAVDLLQDFKGVFHSDKFGAYEKLAQSTNRTWCPCWAHIRRKFIEAETGDPDFRKWILRHIRYLFLLERIAWARSEEERLRIRKEKEAPIIDKIIAACKDKLTTGRILPKSKLGGALGYLLGLTPYLKNYTKHSNARLDNNVAERAVRPLAVGRKNWMFVGSHRGGRATAILLSLIQTCRGLGVNPREYLEDIMRRIMGHPANKLRELLPDQWAINRKPSNIPSMVPFRGAL